MLAAELGDRRCQAAALNNLGRLAHRMGDEARAVALCSKRLSLQRGPGDKRSMATALASLGQITGS